MPARTSKRQQAIIDVAAAVFEESGYDAASMATISARLGGSKTTLYGYFSSKEALFTAVVDQILKKRAQEVLSLLDVNAPVCTALTAFSQMYIEIKTRNDAMMLFSIAASSGRKNGLGARLYTGGPRQLWLSVADRLDAWRARGDLAFTSKNVAALHFKGLLETGLLEPLLFGCEPEISVEEGIEEAVTAFLRLYGPLGTSDRAGQDRRTRS